MGPPHDFKQSAGKRNLPEKIRPRWDWKLGESSHSGGARRENQTKVGLKVSSWERCISRRAGENQTKVGLKVYLLYKAVNLTLEKIRPRWDWKNVIISRKWSVPLGENQTKVGLKDYYIKKFSLTVRLRKSDQGGIERKFCARIKLRQMITRKSDQGGIERKRELYE